MKKEDKKSVAKDRNETGEIRTPMPTNQRGDGIKMKGAGAATKGTRCRGPMG